MPTWEPVLPLQFPSRDSMTVAFLSVSRFWFHRFLHWVFTSCLVVLPPVARFWLHQFPHWVFAWIFSFSGFLFYFIYILFYFYFLFYNFYLFIYLFFILFYFLPVPYSSISRQRQSPPPLPGAKWPYTVRCLTPALPVPFPNLTPLFWSLGSINAWWSALSRETQSSETIVTLSSIQYEFFPLLHVQ